jgi:hypothetical protein
MFASRVKKVVTLNDGDVDVGVTIRKLSARSLEKASDARQSTAIARARDAGGELVKIFRETDEVKAAAAAAKDPIAAAKARYAAYDRAAVLLAGVESWTSDVKLPQGLDDLDEEAADLLHREILDLSLPPLDPEAAEAVGKVA